MVKFPLYDNILIKTKMNKYLQHRANINTISFEDKSIVIYEDHRYFLNILKFYKINKTNSFPINVVYFDFHDDCYKNDSILSKNQINKVKKFNFENFYNYIEFKHSNQDDDWLISGCEYGLIRHGINILGQNVDNINELNGHYKDTFGKIHNILSLSQNPHIPSNDNIKKFQHIIKNNFILDFDLDFMTKMEEGKNIAYNETELDELYNQKFINGATLKETITELIKNAKNITICKESKYCGGFDESNKLLQYLNKTFFNNRLNELNS